ncbi:MAG TPA: VOC family protein [Phototrophicaceae bacterium]|nr:VOC family protein [Phototrophicaceae bacterium]
MTKKVTGIGGIFFKAKDPAALGAWYADHFGFELPEGMQMTTFPWRRADDPTREGETVWSLFPQDSDYFGSDTPFMVNYIVEDLDATLAELKAAGAVIIREAEDSPYGRFAAVKDPEGNGIELWQPANND